MNRLKSNTIASPLSPSHLACLLRLHMPLLPISVRSSIPKQLHSPKPQERSRSQDVSGRRKRWSRVSDPIFQTRAKCVWCVRYYKGQNACNNRNARIRVKGSLKGSKMFIQVKSKRNPLHCPRSSSSPVRSSNTAALLRCCCRSCRRRCSFHVDCCGGAHLLERCTSCCSVD